MQPHRMKLVYVIHDRCGRRNSSRIGIAFVAADGALNVKLDAIPLSGELQIRDYAPPEPEGAALGPAPGELRREGLGESGTESSVAAPHEGSRV